MNADFFIDISLAHQQLTLVDRNRVLKSYPVSTAKNGAGERRGSECTPRGWHRIRAKIGANQPINSVFIGRRPTGEIYHAELAQQQPKRDWILTRILWLDGLEPGKNRYREVDTASRYIYIHGCPDALLDGKPGSHGCIRMSNDDIIELFDRVPAGACVYLHE